MKRRCSLGLAPALLVAGSAKGGGRRIDIPMSAPRFTNHRKAEAVFITVSAQYPSRF